MIRVRKLKPRKAIPSTHRLRTAAFGFVHCLFMGGQQELRIYFMFQKGTCMNAICYRLCLCSGHVHVYYSGSYDFCGFLETFWLWFMEC